jgi:hypothetical protein
MKKQTKRVIGRTEVIDFPEWGIEQVRAKVDTGAYTSAIHCSKVRLIKIRNEERLSFYLPAHRGEKRRRMMADKFTLKAIKNSFGVVEMRYIVQTRVTLFGKTFRAEFSLADREKMRFPVLLGRKFLRNRFIVDVSLENQSLHQKLTLLPKTSL